MTTKTTPSFTTADPELAEALEDALDGIELRRKSEFDYVLRHVDGHRGGVIVANPVTAALRELGSGRHPFDHEVRARGYLHNCAGRAPGGPPGPARQRRRPGHPARPHLPHPVHDLLRAARATTSSSSCARSAASPTRRRRAAGPRAGRARTAARSITAPTRTSSTSGCPAAIEPFRLARKRDALPRARRRAARCASSTAIEPAARRRRSASRSRPADSLYVTDDFLVTHNTLNDSLHHPRRGAEHDARSR